MVRSEHYFSAELCRREIPFREKSRRAWGQAYTLELDARGPAEEVLTIDIGMVWLRPAASDTAHFFRSPRRGGFAGSATQLQFLDKMQFSAR